MIKTCDLSPHVVVAQLLALLNVITLIVSAHRQSILQLR